MGLNEVLAKIGEDLSTLKRVCVNVWEHVVEKNDDIVAIWERKSNPDGYKPSTLVEMTMIFIAIVQAFERRAGVEVTTSKVELVAKMARAYLRHEANVSDEESEAIWKYRSFFFSRALDSRMVEEREKPTSTADSEQLEVEVSKAIDRGYKAKLDEAMILKALVEANVEPQLALAIVVSEGFKHSRTEEQMLASLRGAELDDEVLKPHFASLQKSETTSLKNLFK